jgi:hypothetical protein
MFFQPTVENYNNKQYRKHEEFLINDQIKS